MTSQGGAEIKQLSADDWQVLRDVRLAAFLDAPECLGDRYEDEKTGNEERWRTFLQERPRFVALVEDRPVGMISVGEGQWSGTAAVTGLWVDPRFRCRGIGDTLVVTALEWARDKDLRQVFLRVNEGCDAAERLYRDHGFQPTGETRPLGDGRLEYEFELRF